MQQDFSLYGKNFQEKLVQLILEDRPFSEQMQEVLDIKFYKYLQIFFLGIETSIVYIPAMRY